MAIGYKFDGLGALLRRIGREGAIDDSQLTSFLTLPSVSERCQVNLELAGAYYNRYEKESDERALRHAASCMERVFLLSGYSAEVLPLLIKINRALGDIGAIKEALKRAGLEQAACGNFDGALSLFDRWMYADAEFTDIDIHTYDPEIIACVERMGALHRFEPNYRLQTEPGGKLRVAYLMQGLTHINSVLVKIDQVFARLHDKSQFEIAYFTVDSESAVALSKDAQATIQKIRCSGCQISAAPDSESLYERLLKVGKQIHDFAPDVLVTSGALATFKNYFITSLNPAPVTISFHQGPSAQFSWRTFDHSISWFRALLLDCPTDCSHVPLEFDLPEREEISAASRSDLDIPEDAVVILSGGRPHKFQDPGFWRAMAELLLENDGLYWIIIGFHEDQVSSLTNQLAPEARAKIRFQGWRQDYLEVLAAANLFVDSYPLGGGVFLVEAMGLGLPTISFEHDYISVFRNDVGSGGDEIVGIPELLIRRGDFHQLKRTISKLISDTGYRQRLGAKCSEQARTRLGDPVRMVRRCEEIYQQVWSRAAEAAGAGLAADSSLKRPPSVRPEEKSIEEYRLLLLEQEELLNRREAALNHRESRRKRPLLLKLRGQLRQGLDKLRHK